MEDTLKTILEAIDTNNRGDITIIDVKKMSSIADYFLICTCQSTTQVKTLAERVQDQLEQKDIFTLRTDGIMDGRWAILDYGDIIVHIFLDQTRLFYCLDELWSDGTNVTKYNSEDTTKSEAE